MKIKLVGIERSCKNQWISLILIKVIFVIFINNGERHVDFNEKTGFSYKKTLRDLDISKTEPGKTKSKTNGPQ